ncbi:MAG: DUF4317 domain-containing protein [Clostridia bacterium]|nr:DUF4317 domain-containing protein [Clostridia bacterium]
MNEKEISEIRRRYRLDRTGISRICGCFINEKKEIISEFEQSMGSMSEDDAEGMLTILKKVLSGAQGRNIHEIEFSTAEVSESEDYKLISDLRTTKLADSALTHALYEKIAGSLELEGNYLILLAHDSYDVFDYTADGEKSTESETVFNYVICAVCPVKAGKPSMSYYMPGKCFRSISADTLLCRPELGFMFPAFDDRRTNIYKTVYYTRNIGNSYDGVAESLFSAKLPMPAAEQKQTFGDILAETVGDECSLRVVRSVHAQIDHKIEEHKNEKTDEPCVISKEEAGEMLRYCGVEEERIEAFEQKFDECFGENSEIPTGYLSAKKKLEVVTPEVTIKVSAGEADVVEARIIDGTKYILIRADNGAIVNGINVTF